MIALIGILIALLLPAVQAARERARRTHCANNLKQLGLAIQGYHGQHGAFPPGCRLHDRNFLPSISWRVMILPMMELGALYEQIDPQPNGGGADRTPDFVQLDPLTCPSAEPPPPSPLYPQPSHYSGVGGAVRGQPRWDDPNDVRAGDVYDNGVLFPESRVRFSQVTDGTSHTLAIGERVYYLEDGWIIGATKSGSAPDLVIDCYATKNILFPINADLEVFGHYPGEPDLPSGARLCADGVSEDRCMLLNHLPFGSEHPGGAQFCLADGSVQFLEDTIDLTVFQDMATRDGGEVGR